MTNSLTKRLLGLCACLAIVLAGLSYLYYTRWQDGTGHTTQPKLPILNHSVFVCSFNKFGKDWKHFQITTLGKDLQEIDCFKQVNGLIKQCSQIGIPTKPWDELPIWISTHKLGDTKTACVFYIGINPLQRKELLTALEQQPFPTIMHSGQRIKIIKPLPAQATPPLYVMIQKDYMVVSLCKELIEEIAQGLSHKQPTTFLDIAHPVYKNQSLIIHHIDLPALVSMALTPEYEKYVKTQLQPLEKMPSLEGKTTTHSLWLTGMLTKKFTGNQPYWMDDVASAPPTVLTPASYIPAQAAAVQYYTFQDPLLLSNKLKANLSSTPQHQPGHIANDAIELSLNQLIKNDMAYCILGPQSTDALVLIHVEEPKKALDILIESNLITNLFEKQLPNSAPIYKLNKSLYAGWLPNLAFPSFSGQLLSTIDHYLVIANNFDTLSKAYKAYEKGYTWALPESASHNFLASTLPSANVSLFVNLRHTWPLLIPLLKPDYRNWCEKNLQAFFQAGYLAVQLIHVAQTDSTPTYSIHVLINHIKGDNLLKPETEGNNSSLSITYFQAPTTLITRPFIVKSHKNKEPYVIVQDADYQLYLLDHTGKLIWKKQLEGPIQTDIYTIDYHNNNKKQYLCSTSESLHLIDCLGNEVPPYPSKLPKSSEKTWLNVIDYEKNKSYRFLIGDQWGNIYLKDRQYTGLPGWNPKALSKPFVMTPFHTRIQKDYFISVHTNGEVYLFNRKGKIQPYFPLNIAASLHNPAVLQPRNQLATSQLILLSDEGTLFTYNLMGVCLRQLVLPKTPQTQYFSLTPDDQGTQQYALFRQDTDTFYVLNEQGDILFEKEHSCPTKLRFQYCTFGNHSFYAITDPEKKTTHLYNSQGNTLHKEAINNSGQPIQICFNEAQQQLTMYTSFENKVQQYQFEVPTLPKPHQ